MTNTQLATLARLFDEVKTKVDDETLEYKFVRDSLKTILEGPKQYLPSVTNITGAIRATFEIESSPPVKELSIVERKYQGPAFAGFEEVGISSLSRFFYEGGSPATEGGSAAVISFDTRISIPECLAQLLNSSVVLDNQLDELIIKSGFSFSTLQVLGMLKDNRIEKAVGRTKKTSVFFVHDSSMTGVACLSDSPAKHYLYGRDLDAPYPYVAGTLFVVRNPPKHLQPR